MNKLYFAGIIYFLFSLYSAVTTKNWFGVVGCIGMIFFCAACLHDRTKPPSPPDY